MMPHRQAIALGRIFGIPIRVDYSWFLIFALMSWTLATGYYPSEFKHWSPAQYWIVGAATAVMLFVSVLLHELGHSLVAKHYGTPVRSITLFIFGGVSQISASAANAGAEFWIAAAGPVVSFALAGLFRIMEPAVAGIGSLFALAKYLAYINLALGIFNLIPGFPLDGGRVLRATLWGTTHDFHRATTIAGNVGRGVAYLLIFWGVWQALGGDFVNGLWIAFIGWFLENAAVSETQHQLVKDLLAGHRVSEAMSDQYPTIPSAVTLQALVDRHVLGAGRRSFVVTRDGEAVGLLTLNHLTRVPRDRWATTAAADAMIPATQLKVARPEQDLWAALEEMDGSGVNQLPVIVDGRARGMLTREDLIRFLRRLGQPSS
jgi:Zn-dependent protease/CBS domain-containing protein